MVYIPLPTALRKEWVIKAAAAGKVGMVFVDVCSISISISNPRPSLNHPPFCVHYTNRQHVLVEKPVGCNTEDVREMIQACIDHNVHVRLRFARYLTVNESMLIFVDFIPDSRLASLTHPHTNYNHIAHRRRALHALGAPPRGPPRPPRHRQGACDR